MICPACHQNIPDASNYCPLCAADLMRYRRQIIAQQARRPADPNPYPAAPMDSQNAYPPDPSGMYQAIPPGVQAAYPQNPDDMYRTIPPQGTQQYAPEEGGFFGNVTPRGKLFFGLGGLVLLAVLVLLIVNLFFGGGGEDDPRFIDTPGDATREPAPTFLDPWTIQASEDPDEFSDDGEDGFLLVQSTPAPTAMPSFTTILKKGDTGEEVRQLQERLTLLGYYKDIIDAEYGPDTLQAVRDFQRAAGLPTDGAAGPETRTKLFSIPLADGADNWNYMDGAPVEPDAGEPVNQPG